MFRRRDATGKIMKDEAIMDFDWLREQRSGLGTAAVIVMDQSTDIIKAIWRLSKFYKHESCGQCTPCREGTGWLYRMLTRIVNGKGTMDDLNKLDDVARKIEGGTICALGDAAAMPVRSFLKHYRHEFAYYVEHGRSLVGETGDRSAAA